MVEGLQEVKVKVTAQINPTEDPEKVLRALKNLFPKVEFRIVGRKPFEMYVGEAEGLTPLEKLKELWRARRVRAAAREYMRKHRVGETFTLFFHKQAAYAGKPALSESEGESPLGPITLEIKSGNPKALLEWMTEGV